MKTQLIYTVIFILIGFSSYSQGKESNDSLIKKKWADGPSTWISYKDQNWDNKFVPMPKEYYETETSRIDIETLKKIAREEISEKYYGKLNESLWTITTKLTGRGEILSVRFSFKDQPDLDAKELRKLAERIKKEIKWNLKFNKEVTDYFNLQFVIRGPKL